MVWNVQWRIRKWRQLGFIREVDAAAFYKELVTAKGVKECYMWHGPFEGNTL